MKKTARRWLALSLLALPAAAQAETSVNSTTIFHAFQEERSGFEKKEYAPLTQFLGVDSDQLGDGNLSLHLHGWGRFDLADKSYDNDRADGSLIYGYLRYRFPQANGQATLGRFQVFEGIVNEQVDGIGASSDLPYGFGISAFGGATVHTEDLPGEKSDGKGNGIVGGRLNYRYGGKLELGLSGVYESQAPELENQLPASQGKFGSHRLVGGDIWFAPHRMVEMAGHTSYNTETSGVAEHSYLVTLRPRVDLTLSCEFNEQNERDLFYSSVMFATLVQGLDDESRSIGGRASYQLTKSAELAGDYKHYDRDLGKADRFGGNLRFTLAEKGVRSGLGYHYLRSSPDFAPVPTSGASGSFHEARGWAMHDTKRYFAALDAIGYFFREEINNRSSAVEVIGSLGYHLSPALALSGDLSYGSNPQFDSELQGVLRLTYDASFTGKGGSK